MATTSARMLMLTATLIAASYASNLVCNLRMLKINNSKQLSLLRKTRNQTKQMSPFEQKSSTAHPKSKQTLICPHNLNPSKNPSMIFVQSCKRKGNNTSNLLSSLKLNKTFCNQKFAALIKTKKSSFFTIIKNCCPSHLD